MFKLLRHCCHLNCFDSQIYCGFPNGFEIVFRHSLVCLDHVPHPGFDVKFQRHNRGLTEKKAINIINKAKKTGNYADVKKWGLENFKRDTMWVAVLDTIFPKGFNPDSMRYVPFGNGAQFEMAIKNDTAKSGAPFCLLEVKTPYEVYLNGLDAQEIANIKDVQTKLGKYCGLMIGSLETANNNAGNWE